VCVCKNAENSDINRQWHRNGKQHSALWHFNIKFLFKMKKKFNPITSSVDNTVEEKSSVFCLI